MYYAASDDAFLSPAIYAIEGQVAKLCGGACDFFV